MEVLLTLESVVDNLAECLKNNDLMAILTRFVSLLDMYIFKYIQYYLDNVFVLLFVELQSLIARFPQQFQAAVQQEEHRAAQSEERREGQAPEELFCSQKVWRG